MTLNGNSRQTLDVQAGQVLTVIADSLASGRVNRLGASVGEQAQSINDIASDTTTKFGPYQNTERFELICDAGSFTVTIERADLTALPLGQSASFVVTPTNLTCSNGLSIVPLDTAITADVTTTDAPEGSIGFMSHATGIGKLFMSDGAKWQFAVVA